MAVSLYEAGAFTWSRFTDALIARIGAWEATAKPGEPYSYYRHWLDALQDVLVDLGAVSAADVTTRVRALAERPAGHDHGHEHDHAHEHDHDHAH